MTARYHLQPRHKPRHAHKRRRRDRREAPPRVKLGEALAHLTRRQIVSLEQH